MKWRDYLVLGRPSNLPTVWTNVLTGAVLVGRTPPLTLILSASLLYTAGMFLNDAFDREIDARQRPDRPIPQGRVSAREAFSIGGGLLFAGVMLVALFAPWGAVFAGLGLALAIVFYDAWHKTNPLAPVVMGTCRALLYVMAALYVAELDRGVLLAALALLSYVAGLTYVARQENLASFGGSWPLWLLALPFVYALRNVELGLSAILFAALLAWVLRALWLLTRKKIGAAVVSLIAGISLLDALIIAEHGQPLLAVLAASGLIATLLAQKWVSGT